MYLCQEKSQKSTCVLVCVCEGSRHSQIRIQIMRWWKNDTICKRSWRKASNLELRNTRAVKRRHEAPTNFWRRWWGGINPASFPRLRRKIVRGTWDEKSCICHSFDKNVFNSKICWRLLFPIANLAFDNGHFIKKIKLDEIKYFYKCSIYPAALHHTPPPPKQSSQLNPKAHPL